jgi:hypothetical protein
MFDLLREGEINRKEKISHLLLLLLKKFAYSVLVSFSIKRSKKQEKAKNSFGDQYKIFRVEEISSRFNFLVF